MTCVAKICPTQRLLTKTICQRWMMITECHFAFTSNLIEGVVVVRSKLSERLLPQRGEDGFDWRSTSSRGSCSVVTSRIFKPADERTPFARFSFQQCEGKKWTVVGFRRHESNARFLLFWNTRCSGRAGNTKTHKWLHSTSLSHCLGST